MSFDTVLVANRGEIAVRIIRTLREMGLRSVAVFSEADRGAPHVALADSAVFLGPSEAAQSYLSMDRVIAAAKASGAGAIHPGYGFLSENAVFAQVCKEAGLVFIGPSADAIRVMGDKAVAKQAMLEAGVPCVPGYHGSDQSEATLQAKAAEIGYPVMLKAVAGGGGKGMRLVEGPEAFGEALDLAQSEAQSAFGSGEMMIEKALIGPRHIEIQVFADSQGNVIHLGERDCSVQRRHQKVLEEAPSPFVSADLRARMGQTAVRAAEAIGYVGAGTVEFLTDDAGAFYFLEMNTRLQVEHPVTELVTGADLVEWQVQVAQGEALPIGQDDVVLTGHAIEARVYAESPGRGFMPSSGAIERLAFPEGVRVDAGVAEGDKVSAFYDPMLAKVIAHGANREVARRRLRAALEGMTLFGPESNQAYLLEVLDSAAFVAGEARTDFVEKLEMDFAVRPEDIALAACVLYRAQAVGARARLTRAAYFDLEFDGQAVAVRVEQDGGQLRVICGDQVDVFDDVSFDARRWQVTREGVVLSGQAHVVGSDVWLKHQGRIVHGVPVKAGADAESGSGTRITAPMHGRVLSVALAVGDEVAPGEAALVVEAMKMQHTLQVPLEGRVSGIHVGEGDQVATGQVLVEFEEVTS